MQTRTKIIAEPGHLSVTDNAEGKPLEDIVRETRSAEGDRNITPKGIDDADVLATASSDVLLQRHLDLEKRDGKNFWKDGFLLFKLWTTGAFRSMVEPGSPVVSVDQRGL